MKEEIKEEISRSNHIKFKNSLVKARECIDRMKKMARERGYDV